MCAPQLSLSLALCKQTQFHSDVVFSTKKIVFSLLCSLPDYFFFLLSRCDREEAKNAQNMNSFRRKKKTLLVLLFSLSTSTSRLGCTLSPCCWLLKSFCVFGLPPHFVHVVKDKQNEEREDRRLEHSVCARGERIKGWRRLTNFMCKKWDASLFLDCKLFSHCVRSAESDLIIDGITYRVKSNVGRRFIIARRYIDS